MTTPAGYAILTQDLAFHLVAVHADPMAIARSHADNLQQHQHEHFGPCGIRHHSFYSRKWGEDELEAVLEEAEESA